MGNPNSTLFANMVLKIRSLIEDFGDKDFQVFTYSNSNIFTLREPNIQTFTKILINGLPLQSGQGASFDVSSNQLTITGVTFHPGDTIQVNYTFVQYSDDRLAGYIRGALTYLSIYDYSTLTYQILQESAGVWEIFPDLSDPKDKTGDLICIITSILILPEYMHYRMPNLAINYPYKKNREERITDIITRYKHGVGIIDIIQWNRSPGL